MRPTVRPKWPVGGVRIACRPRRGDVRAGTATGASRRWSAVTPPGTSDGCPARFADSEAQGTACRRRPRQNQAMAPLAAYDEIADWYEKQFLPTTGAGDPIGIRRSLAALLGAGA